LYKTAFKNLEYWDGNDWIGDIKKLKSLSRSEREGGVGIIDAWKKDLEMF
jgi:hypothetical protein